MQIEQLNRSGMSGIKIYQWGKKPVEDWSFHPYFYIPVENEIPKGILGVELAFTAVDGKQVMKIICKESQDVHKLRGDVHYEASSPYTSKYWVDKVGTWKESKPRVCGIDIEAASTGTDLTEAMIENAPDAIIIIGIQLDNGKIIQFCWKKNFKIETISTKKREIRKFKTEKQMANAFVNCLRLFKPEIISGFNILGYDIPYLMNRFTKVGVDFSSISPQNSAGIGYTSPYIKGVALFDYFLGYTNIKKRKFIGNKLDDVLKRELGLQKYKGVDSSQLAKAWKLNADEVLEYNFHDVDRMMQLDRKMEILDTHIMFHNVYGCNLSDTLYPGKMLENYMSRRLDFIYSSTKKVKGMLKGAEPKPPIKGVHENILFADLTSAYPFGVISGNMSVETKVDVTDLIEDEREKLIDINGVYFLQPETKKGAYVEIVEELFEKKDYWSESRDLLQFKSLEWKNANAKRTAFKVGINTIYGLTGDVHSKFYDVEIANSVTAITRGVIDFVTHEVKELGHKYIFGHTDSIGFQTKYKSLPKMIKAGEDLCDHLNGRFPMHLRQYNILYKNAKMNIDFERIAKIGIFSGKTRYAIKILYADGVEVKDDGETNIEMKGWDAIRSDSSIMAKKLQKQMIIDILDKKDRREIEPYYQKELKKIRDGEYPIHLIGVPAEFKKKFKEYPNSYYRVVGAEWSNEHLGTSFEMGTKPFFIGATAPSKFSCPNNIAIDKQTEIPEWLNVDYDGAMKKTQKKLGYVYDCLGWDVNSLLGQKTLGDF